MRGHEQRLSALCRPPRGPGEGHESVSFKRHRARLIFFTAPASVKSVEGTRMTMGGPRTPPYAIFDVCVRPPGQCNRRCPIRGSTFSCTVSPTTACSPTEVQPDVHQSSGSFASEQDAVDRSAHTRRSQTAHTIGVNRRGGSADEQFQVHGCVEKMTWHLLPRACGKRPQVSSAGRFAETRDALQIMLFQLLFP